jgi:hypothetical protein
LTFAVGMIAAMRLGTYVPMVSLLLVGCGNPPRRPPPPLADDQLTLSATPEACQGPRTLDRVRACLADVADALEREGRKGAFNGRMEAGTACWTVEGVEPVMGDLCKKVRDVIETNGKTVEYDDCGGSLVVVRTKPEAAGTMTYNVRVKLIEARLFVKQCVFSRVQWSAYAMIEGADRSVVVRSDKFANTLAKTVRPYLDQL